MTVLTVRRDSTITIKSLYVITYVCQNFGVRDVLGKYQKTYKRLYTFYIVIFLTIFAKLVLIRIEWRIANSAKANIEVSFKKRNPRHNPKNIFKKNYCLKRVKLCFLVTFNIIINYIFPENFTEIHEVFQKIWIFTSSILTIFVNFFSSISLRLLATKKLLT